MESGTLPTLRYRQTVQGAPFDMGKKNFEF
jgi:hypothetical protein